MVDSINSLHFFDQTMKYPVCYSTIHKNSVCNLLEVCLHFKPHLANSHLMKIAILWWFTCTYRTQIRN